MKNLTKNSMLVLCLLMAISPATNAESGKPSWIENLPKNDGTFNYYIGRSTGSISEAEAFTHATINAREQAITQNYGVYTQIRSENYQSVETSQSTQNFEAISQQVRLEEFEQVDFFQENQSERKNVWVLFKYKRSAIEFEKNRLKHLKQNNDDYYKFMISGNLEGAKINGTIEVTSSPSGAPVRIDGKSNIGDLELRTPLRLMGLFMTGKHTIEIDDPKYELVQKEIVLYPGTTAKVDELLKRAYGELTIDSETVGATVFLGTKPIGTTPLERPIQIMAENSASIEVRHPEMETYRLQTLVSRGEKKNEQISLIARPSTISCSSDPRGADVEIDGVLKGKNTPSGQINISRGSHRVRISKEGYRDYETNVYVKGGENLVLENVKLEYIQTGRLIGINKFSDASLSLDGKYFSSSTNQINLSPGNYKLRISKNGYETHEEEIKIKEGKSRDISSIDLKEITSQEENILETEIPRRRKDQKKTGNPNFYISFGTFSNVTYIDKKKSYVNAPGGTIGFQILSRLGFEFSYFNINSNKRTSEDTPSEVIVKRRIEVARIGIPLTFIKAEWIANDSFSIIPEAIQITNKYSTEFKSKKYSVPEIKTKQTGLGASIYYRSLSDKSNGIGLRLGRHTYSSPDKQSHSKAFSGGIEFVIGF